MSQFIRLVKDFIRNKVPLGDNLLAHMAIIRSDSKTLLGRGDSWRVAQKEWPSDIFIETTNICNVNCIFCAYQYQENFREGRGFISEADFRQCVDIHAKMGGKCVWLTPIVGEPLLDETILDKIEYIIGKNMETSFFTNGVRLKYIDQERLLKSGIKGLTLSTAPFDKQLFESIYRSDGYDDLLSGVQNLLRIRNISKTDFTLSLAFRSYLSYKETLNMPDFKKHIWPLLSEKEREIVVINYYDNWGGQIKRKDLLPGMRLKPLNRIKSWPCIWSFFPMISWDGKVRACACRFRGDEKKLGDDLIVGELHAKSLEEIWLSKNVNSLHNRFVMGDVPRVCRDCSAYGTYQYEIYKSGV